MVVGCFMASRGFVHFGRTW